MSDDDDDDFMQDSDQEDFDFEYEDGDDNQEGDLDIENTYYNAKQIKVDDPKEAVDMFLTIPKLEPEKGDWGFKGLKQAIKLEFKLKRYEEAVNHFEQLLTYVKSDVTRNYSEKSVTNMLDFIEKNADDVTANSYIERFYFLTLESFKSLSERLWLKTNLKLARLWFNQRLFHQLDDKLKELHAACKRPPGSNDTSKGTISLETYALDIQMNVETRNNKRLKVLYGKALRIDSAVPHPKILGIIHECGAKMHLSEENWRGAYSDFFESFKNYDEAGSLQRIQVLKYLVLTTMLMGSDINPFDSQETKPYKNDPRVSAMTDLVDAYQRDDVDNYERVLRETPDLLTDPFISEHMGEVTQKMRTKAVLKLIAPYTCFSLQSVSKKLKVPLIDVQGIISDLIIDKQLKASIDGPTQIVYMHTNDDDRAEAIQSWTNAIGLMQKHVLGITSTRFDDELGQMAIQKEAWKSFLGPSKSSKSKRVSSEVKA